LDIEVQEEKPDSQEEETPEKKPKNLFREFLEMVIYVIGVALAAFFLYHYVVQQVEVDGHSMMDTLDHGEHLILEKISYRFGDPKRFDIIVFRPYEDEKTTYYIKRIIGLPGETVQIVDSDIYIDGELLEEDYGSQPIEDPGLAEEPVTLGKDEYFVLGDNRNNSMDSRDERVENVKRDAIMGRAWVRMWPLNKIGVLSHK
jgi:signal peptidase I